MTTTSTATRPAPQRTGRFLGKCTGCGTVLVRDSTPGGNAMAVTCGSCGKRTNLPAVWGRDSGTRECDARCTGAKRADCDCSCVGANHGADHR